MAERSGIVSIGECMVELARQPDGRYGASYGGDTFNAAVYLARAGMAVTYATALGDDPYSRGILDLASAEGISTELIQIAPGRMPGLYLIQTTPDGERSFHYWRGQSPARELFDGPQADVVASAIARARLVYFSGITLSLYRPDGLDRLAAALMPARANGITVAMDSNYRSRGWPGDPVQARATFERFWRLADIALPTFDDEAALWGDRQPDETVARLRSFGVREIVVKLGADGAICADRHGALLPVAVPAHVKPVDTSAAGDSFNAAYLASRLRGTTPVEAALAGHRLAGVVIQHRGAIAPLTATRAVLSLPSCA